MNRLASTRWHVVSLLRCFVVTFNSSASSGESVCFDCLSSENRFPQRQSRNDTSFFLFRWLVVSLLLLNGCGGYIQRMVTRSLERIGEPVESAPMMISTPVLDNPPLAISWVGHATVLVQIRDKVFITDPLFTDYIGMVVKRYVGPGLDPSLLPRIDFTLISHIHMDHFSFGSLDMLPKNGTLVIPQGLLRYTPDFGFRGLKELKPWESIEEDGVRVTAVPVQHFSGRYGIDNAWLGQKGYTGYVFEYAGTTVFVGGDTGYHPELFKEIGRRFPIDVALLPIAPGSLTNLGGRVHVGPLGALTIMQDLGAAYMVPMHHRTMFYGSDSNPTQAIESLRSLAAQMGLSDRIIDLDIGEQRVLRLNSEGLPAGLP